MDGKSVTENDVVDEMRDIIGSDCYGPIPEGRIVAAEEELGVSFPTTYRIFLRHFGAAVVFYELEGLPDTRNSGPEMPIWSNVIDTTLSMRPGRSGNGMEDHYVFLTSNGGDIQFYLDTSRRDDRGECPVVSFGDVNEQGGIVASDFLGFLRQLDRRSREYDEWRANHGVTWQELAAGAKTYLISQIPEVIRQFEERARSEDGGRNSSSS